MTNTVSSKQQAPSRDSNPASCLLPPARYSRGFTLIELMVSVGLFAMIMLLASGAYLMMISINRQTQSIATGINNLSFALETMTRTIRTGTGYSSGGTSFSVTDANGRGDMKYERLVSNGRGSITQNGVALTDPSVDIKSMTFYASGTSSSDALQPRVTIIVTGEVSYGPGKTQEFTVETGATMRGTDL